MARRVREITREDLLHRYANARGWTYGQTHDVAGGIPDQELRAIVELAEAEDLLRGSRRSKSWARSQPTTTVQGQTR